MFPSCETDFNLGRHLIPFLQDVPFFAEISRHIRKVPTRAMPTAAIAFDPKADEITLFWNPDFMESLGNWQIRGLLTHEFYHLVFGHLNSRRKTPPMLWNIATDLAINSLIVGNPDNSHRGLSADRNDGPLPECALIPGQWPKSPEGKELTEQEKKSAALGQIIVKLPPNQSSEWYYNKLFEEAKKYQEANGDGDGEGEEGDGFCEPGEGNPFGKGGRGIGSMDDHSMWDEVPEERREYVEGKVKSIIEKAVREADQKSNGWGNIPGELREDIRRSVSTIINWRAVLRQFIGTLVRGHRRNSMKRINRRYPYIHPGTTRGYVAKLIIAIDQSGSVHDEMLELFFAELNSLTKKVDITILPFDCHCGMKDLVEWKRGTAPPAKRTKMGGTDFNAPTQLVNDPKNRGRWDGLLVMTDGCAPEPVSSRVKRGWVLGKGCKLEWGTESELQINLDDKKPLTGAWR